MIFKSAQQRGVQTASASCLAGLNLGRFVNFMSSVNDLQKRSLISLLVYFKMQW